MSEQEAFAAIFAPLQKVALNPVHWMSATALIDDALHTHGSSMICGDSHSAEDIRIILVFPPTGRVLGGTA